MDYLSKRITGIVSWGLLIGILNCRVKTDTIQVSMPLDENQPQAFLDKNNYRSTNLDIKPFPNNLGFMFQYNDDDYYILFGGKEEEIVSAYINKNRTREEIAMIENGNFALGMHSDSIGLTREDISLINRSIKDSIIYDTDCNFPDNLFILHIFYDLRLEDYSRIRCNVSVIPTKELKSYLIDKLLHIYSLPVYEVKEGDTLNKLVLQFSNSNDWLESFFHVNPRSTWHEYDDIIIHIGERLRIPHAK
jgi:hypothetical protein